MSRLLLAFAVVVLGACGDAGEQPRFRLLDADRTGIEFSNDVPTDDSLNAQNEIFIYNGGGVAAGDIDNDGLTDLYFTGNMVSSRLYRNTGEMRFEDITTSAGVGTTGWASGAALADVNDDGFLDLFVCVTGLKRSRGADRKNLLFLNNGNRTFTEAAARYGLADTGFTVAAAFLDYDADGDLDLFLLNNSPKEFSRGASDAHPLGARSDSPEGYNTLYRNDGERFTDVSRAAGILRQVGHGLGVAVADVNRDGRPDIYVSNDVQPNDVLYINNGDGTFSDRAATSVKHASFAGMGVDIADFNNDGWPDIAQVDMLPATLEQRKRMSGYHTYFSLVELRRRGFRVDYDHNTLQLSNGMTPGGDVIFSEIGWHAGIAATDWSWSALFADLDNDGFKDLFITNGFPKASNDLDYQMVAMGARQSGRREDALRAMRELRGYHVPNYLFRNNGDLTFSDQSHAWGLSQPGFSHGAAYADLNNDGRLELVVNNLNAPASIYAGTAVDSAHYLQVKLEGEAPNRRAIGATIVVTAAGKRQYFYHSPYRGYLSTMDDREHVGLGRAARVDSLQVFWPDGRTELLTNIEADRMITVKQVSGVRCRNGSCLPHPPTPTRHLFQQADLISYAQPRRATVDYEVQPLLPYEVSKQGPALAVADVNGDGLEDVYVGGNANAGGKLFVQQKSGRFVEAAQRAAWTEDKGFEDWGAAFVDANGDGRPDLYVASCSYQHSPASRFQQDRLYINRGNGQFARDTAALPAMPTCSASVAVGDFSGDGRPDLFVGGRLTPRSYPFPARSYLLRNEGGRFSDVTAAVAPELAQPHGMITAAVWTDYDGDGRLDLVTAGEWLGIEFWRNAGTRLVPRAAGLPPSRGWWWSLAAGDFNRDGKPDLIAGNLGLNTMLQTSPGSRFGVYAGNFAETPSTDIVLTQEHAGKEYPLFGRARLGPTMYVAALRFPTYAGFANATVEQLFGAAALARAQHYQADTFASVYLQNRGDGTFTWTPLPSLAQIAPIRGIVARDMDGDGNLDAVVAGNLNDTEANIAPADAGNGLWLRGDGRGGFSPVASRESGFLAPRNVAGLAHVQTPAGSAVIVANTGDSLQAFVIRKR